MSLVASPPNLHASSGLIARKTACHIRSIKNVGFDRIVGKEPKPKSAQGAPTAIFTVFPDLDIAEEVRATTMCKSLIDVIGKHFDLLGHLLLR